MHKKIVKRISLVVIPVAILIGMLFSYNFFLDFEIEKDYNPKIGSSYGIDAKNKGLHLLQISSKRDDLFIIGSSELSAAVPQNPQKMFPNTTLDCNISLVGNSRVQNLLNTILIGSLSEELKGKKVAIIMSFQWFLEKKVDTPGFQSRFSELQFYKLLKNQSISEETKNYISKRVVALTKDQPKLQIPNIYAQLHSHKDEFLSNAAMMALSPYYFARENFLKLKDKHMAFKKILKYEDKISLNTVNINWQEEKIKAEEDGKAECTNNEFYVKDIYYNKYLKSKIDKLKGSNANIDPLIADEYDDFAILLALCKEIGVEPYFVLPPVNGWYYDYSGLPKEKRDPVFDKLVKMISENGYDYLDLRNKDYEPYFLEDIMHLGWKGWVTVNEEISKHFSQNNS